MTRPSTAADRRAFSLVELLIVMVVIIILIGLVLAGASAVKKAAYVANTQSELSTIAGAIQRYYSDFGAYPGAYSNIDITGTTGGGVSASGTQTLGRRVLNISTNTLTQAENMTLSLLGGITDPSAPATTQVVAGKQGTYTATSVGSGPNSVVMQNGAAVIQRHKDPYLSIQPGWLSGGAIAGLTDSNVPEFIDLFPDGLPIIYLRARVGNAGISDAGTDLAQYNVNHMIPYTGALAGIFGGGFDYATSDAYLQNPSLTNTPRGKDSFILISPGKDRVYGTKDDIFN